MPLPQFVLCPLSPGHRRRGHTVSVALAWQVLRRAAVDMARDRQLRAELEWWNKLNIGVQYHSGVVAMCVGIGVLETGGQLDLGSTGTKHKVAAEKEAAVDKLKAMSSHWSKLMLAFLP